MCAVRLDRSQICIPIHNALQRWHGELHQNHVPMEWNGWMLGQDMKQRKGIAIGSHLSSSAPFALFNLQPELNATSPDWGDGDIPTYCGFIFAISMVCSFKNSSRGKKRSHCPLVGGVGVADTFWLFIFTLNRAEKWFNSIFNSKLNQKYSFKKLFNSKNSKIIQKLFNSKNSKNYSFKLGK